MPCCFSVLGLSSVGNAVKNIDKYVNITLLYLCPDELNGLLILRNLFTKLALFSLKSAIIPHGVGYCPMGLGGIMVL